MEPQLVKMHSQGEQEATARCKCLAARALPDLEAALKLRRKGVVSISRLVGRSCSTFPSCSLTERMSQWPYFTMAYNRHPLHAGIIEAKLCSKSRGMQVQSRTPRFCQQKNTLYTKTDCDTLCV